MSVLHASQVVLRPVISEKSMDHTQRSKYTFAVHDDANKMQIKAAVEELFKVTVLDVNVLNTKSKEKSRNRRRGRVAGHTSPWKKAVVTVKAGDSIEFFEGV
jgi:large subunit ribosomal protein L23